MTQVLLIKSSYGLTADATGGQGQYLGPPAARNSLTFSTFARPPQSADRSVGVPVCVCYLQRDHDGYIAGARDLTPILAPVRTYLNRGGHSHCSVAACLRDRFSAHRFTDAAAHVGWLTVGSRARD